LGQWLFDNTIVFLYWKSTEKEEEKEEEEEEEEES